MKRVICIILMLVLLLPSYAMAEETKENIPIIMYHHLSNDEDSWNHAVVSPLKFYVEMMLLKAAGYEPIHFTDYLDHLENGTALPEKPIFITFDDGYYSNYEFAYPILKHYEFKATFFVIGWSVGRDTFIDSDQKITPHFNWDEAKEMFDSGLVDIQSHSFDMHSPEGKSYGYKESCGLGNLPFEGEKEASYEARIYADAKKMKTLIEDKIGNQVIAYAYPYGVSTEVSESIMKALGIQFTLTTVHGIKDLAEGTYLLSRLNMPHDVLSTDLIDEIQKQLNID